MEDRVTDHTPIANEPRDPPADWAQVEIFGHRSHCGRICEEERFGTKMLRIDVPIGGDPAANGWQTLYYGGAAVFSLTSCDEAEAMRRNMPWDARYRLAAPPALEVDRSGFLADAEQHDGEEPF